MKTEQMSRPKKLHAKYFPCIESYQSDLDRIRLKRNGYHNGVYKQREKLSKSPIRTGTGKIKGLDMNALICSITLACTFLYMELQNLCESIIKSVLDGGNIAAILFSDIASCRDLSVIFRTWLQNFEAKHPRIYVDNKKHYT